MLRYISPLWHFSETPPPPLVICVVHDYLSILPDQKCTVLGAGQVLYGFDCAISGMISGCWASPANTARKEQVGKAPCWTSSTYAPSCNRHIFVFGYISWAHNYGSRYHFDCVYHSTETRIHLNFHIALVADIWAETGKLIIILQMVLHTL